MVYIYKYFFVPLNTLSQLEAGIRDENKVELLINLNLALRLGETLGWIGQQTYMKVKSSYCDAKSVLLVIAMFVGAALIWSLPIISWYKTKDIGTAGAKAEKEEIVLNVEVIQGKVLYETDDMIALLAPAKYKIVRAAYGDDCFYNLADRSTYGSGEDVISVNGSYEYTYKISCQPLIGRGGITSKAKTVIVVLPAEIRAAEVVLQSQ